jgi:hypothetical protein
MTEKRFALGGLTIFGLWLFLLAWPAKAQESKLAFWRLQPLGIDRTTAERLEALLRTEVSRMRGVSLQAAEQTDALLSIPERAQLRRCGGETQCLCDIGKALGMDKLITGVIGALGEDYTFDLKLIDISGCREERRINEAFSGREDLLIGAIRQALFKLLAPEMLVGSVLLEVPVEGAEVLMDGQPAGVTPLLGPMTGLRPGNHRLQIRMKGYSVFQDDVPVLFQQTTRVKVDLGTSILTGLSYEKETPPLPPPVLLEGTLRHTHKGPSKTRIAAYSTLAASITATAVGGIFGWRSMVDSNKVSLINKSQKNNLIDESGHLIKEGQRCALWADVSYGVAAGAAVASLVLWIIEWKRTDVAIDKGTSSGPKMGGSLFDMEWQF